jgi:anaerobic magnesium-protoporphyrin IX monomethyl ester cyclase
MLASQVPMRVLFIVRALEAAEPMGLMQLTAMLRHAGHSVRLVGANTTPLIPLMESYRPDLVGYTLFTGEHRYLLRLNRALKRRFAFVAAVGGPHATFFPEVVEEPGVDVVCRGEGEGAIVELANAVEHGEPFDGLMNLWVRQGDVTRKNPMRPLIGDLDALPFADREVRYASDPESRDYPVKSFLAARGCPFRCSYCFNSGFARLYGKAWSEPRERSVSSLLDEIREVRRAGRLELVQFRESIFPWREDWLEELAKRYPRDVGLPFYCHVRADLLTPRRVALLRRAGCVSVNLGIECGDERYRHEVLGRPMTDEQIVFGCRLLKEQGIRILADNMLGLPGAGVEADWATLRLNQRCGVDYALAMLFQPYPGTELADRAKAGGAFAGDVDRIGTSYYVESPLTFSTEREKRETENLQKLFALLVEAPWLERVVRPLLGLPENMLTISVFRAWYMYCYTARIVPHRLRSSELLELARSLFGVFAPEANRELACQDP